VVGTTAGQTAGYSVLDLVSDVASRTFACDARFPVGFDFAEWHNGFVHDPEESARVRIGLFRELAENRVLLAAARLPFPSMGRVMTDGDAFRWVPVLWDY